MRVFKDCSSGWATDLEGASSLPSIPHVIDGDNVGRGFACRIRYRELKVVRAASVGELNRGRCGVAFQDRSRQIADRNAPLVLQPLTIGADGLRTIQLDLSRDSGGVFRTRNRHRPN